MAKVLMVVAPKEYRDEEFEIPRDYLKEKGHDIVVASSTVDLATGALGGSTTVDIGLSEVKADEYDAVIFVGGGGAVVYFDDPFAHSIARAVNARGKLIAAICIAPSIIANAGLLAGKKATAFRSEKQNLTTKGAIYTGNSVEVAGNIITANGPSAAKSFAEEIERLLEK